MSDKNTIEIEEVSLVNPNLGHPRFINYKESSKDGNYQTTLLFISNTEDSDRVDSILTSDRIKLVPVLEYKHRIKFLIKKRKKKGIWARIKNIPSKIFKRKRGKKKEKTQAFRGSPIIPEILNVESVSITSIENPAYLDDEYCYPQNHLVKYHVFGDSTYFFRVLIEFSLTKEVREFLKKRRFVMFDIIHKKEQKRINYHSLVIYNTNWQDFKFIHTTDLHLAERNDHMYGILRHWTRTRRKENIELLSEEESESNASIVDDEKIKKSRFQIDLSFRRRIINPNNLFREFIKFINKKILRNKIDFVIITGDILDFTIMSRLPKELQNSFEYKYSNWQVFKEILLNINQIKRKGIRGTEELLCPVFTVPGNHDYRPWQYDLYWSGIYKNMGLTAEEAQALKEPVAIKKEIKSLLKNKLALKAYWSEINPSQNYSLQLGNHLFIFLNSGPDSFAHPKDFWSGHPSVTGLTDKQIRYLENIIQKKYRNGQNVFLMLHAPPINPKAKRSIFSRIKKVFGMNIRTRLREFRETHHPKERNNARIDDKFNLKIGTLSNNRRKVIKFCKDFCMLTLSGHTHALKEFRLQANDEKLIKSDTESYNLEKSEKPIAVYFDNYSKMYSSTKDIEGKGHFIVQTPGLGLKATRGPFKESSEAGSYREIKIRDGKLSSFKVKTIKD